MNLGCSGTNDRPSDAQATARSRRESIDSQGARVPLLRCSLHCTQLAFLLVLLGCPATSEEVRPPQNQLFFPSSMAVTPDENVLLVTNGNSELRFDSGTLAIVDLDVVEQLLAPWLAERTLPSDTDDCNDCCERDADQAHVLVCNERRVMRPEGMVRIGNFATDIRLQTMSDGSARAFLPVRGDPSVTWVDYDPSEKTLRCGDSGSSFPSCDEAHRLTQMRGDVDLETLTDEPFGAYVDSGNGYAMITHLTRASVTLIDAPPGGEAPQLVDVTHDLFARNAAQLTGSVGVAGRSPGTTGDLVYVTSRSESRIQTLTVDRPAEQGTLPRIVRSDFFFLSNPIPADDARGIVFSADSTRAFITNRDPPALHVIDTSLSETGSPRNTQLSSVEMCTGTAVISIADMGRGERVFASCFSLGQLWIIDPNAATVEAIISIGRGPHAVTVSPTRKRAYVSNFLEDTIAVVDMTPGSATENRMVMRIGRSRQSGGN